MLRHRLHGHQCARCDHVWEHHPDDLVTHDDFLLGHQCLACGYDGDECYEPIPPPSETEAYHRRLGL